MAVAPSLVRSASVSRLGSGRLSFAVRAFHICGTLVSQMEYGGFSGSFARHSISFCLLFPSSSVCCVCIFSLLMRIFRPSSASLSPSLAVSFKNTRGWHGPESVPASHIEKRIVVPVSYFTANFTAAVLPSMTATTVYTPCASLPVPRATLSPLAMFLADEWARSLPATS